MQRVVLRNIQRKSMLMGSTNRVMMQRYFSSQFGVDKANIPNKAYVQDAATSVSSVTSIDADQPINFPPVQMEETEEPRFLEQV
jgi:hypothetical protein